MEEYFSNIMETKERSRKWQRFHVDDMLTICVYVNFGSFQSSSMESCRRQGIKPRPL